MKTAIVYLVVALGQGEPVEHSQHADHDTCMDSAVEWIASHNGQPAWAACLTEAQRNRFFQEQDRVRHRIEMHRT